MARTDVASMDINSNPWNKSEFPVKEKIMMKT